MISFNSENILIRRGKLNTSTINKIGWSSIISMCQNLMIGIWTEALKGRSLPIRIISGMKRGPTLIQCSIKDPTPLKKGTRIATSKRNEVNAPPTFLITLQSSTNIPLQSNTKIPLQSRANIHLQSSTNIHPQSSTNIPSSISQLITSTNQDQVVKGTPVS